MPHPLKMIAYFALAVPVFFWAWLMEQPGALKMAWLNSFATAKDRLWRDEMDRQ